MTFAWTVTHEEPVLDAITAYRVGSGAPGATPGAQHHWWLILIELEDTSLSTFRKTVKKHGSARDLIVPKAYAHDMDFAAKSWLVAIFARAPLIRKLNVQDNPFGVVNLRDGLVIDADTLDEQARAPDVSTIPVLHGTVVMAVIDDGIAIGHNLFRRSAMHTRVDYALIMGARPDQAYPSDCSLGRALDARGIDELLCANTRGDVLEEPSFYRATGQIDYFDQQFSPVSLRRSHGTHVTALAAGYRMGTCRRRRPILCASLPSRVTEDVTGQSMLPAVALALQCLDTQSRRYVLKDRQGKTTGHRAPMVLNFSFGNYAGPHDGTGMFARLFAQYLGDDPKASHRATVLPAGNGNLARVHAELMLNAPDKGDSSSRTLNLVIPPDDRTASHVQFWLPVPESMPSGFARMRVTAPDGAASPWLVLGSGNRPLVLRDDARRELAVLSFTMESCPTGRGVATLSINPTADLDGHTALARAGRWKIEVARNPQKIRPAKSYLKPDAIQVWIRRDETLPGFQPGGRQATFDDADYVWFYDSADLAGAPMAVDPPRTTALVRRTGTLSGFATGVTTFVVGAAVGKTYRISDYSATGAVTYNANLHLPPGSAPRFGPDAMLRGDDSPVQRGVYSAGSRSGSYARLSGTSVAAPRFARLLAELSSRYRTLDRTMIDDVIANLHKGRLEGPIERGGGRPMLEVPLCLLDLPREVLQGGIVPIWHEDEI
ncbi:MAG: S8 family serine peptidase [Pseudomonadota bacterium]